MNRHKIDLDKLIFWMAGIIGGSIFLLLYGIRILNPCYVDWLLTRGDLTQHYLGWEFFRKSDWFFPIGLTDQIAYPNLTSVIFTDSIPLLAVPCKLLESVLPDRFQYFGWWGLLCFVLQGYFAAKILRYMKVGKIQTVIASVLFVLAPTMLDRMYKHTSLGGQWIILLCIYLYIRHSADYKNVRKTVIYWGMIGLLIASVHLYFLPMCGLFVCIYVFKSYIVEKKITIIYSFPGIACVLGVLICTWILGGFTSNAQTGAGGLGNFSYNLNAFLNPMGCSRILPDLVLYDGGQIEGFAYLGLGVIILAFAAFGVFVGNDRCLRWDYVAIIIVLTIFAASPTVTLGNKVIMQIPFPDMVLHYWEIFRSSGREIWPVCYLIMIFSVVYISKININKYVSLVALTVGLCIQIWDISGRLISIYNQYQEEAEYQEKNTGIWGEIADREYEHIVYAHPGIDVSKVLNLAEYAIENDMTMSNFYFARNIDLGDYIQVSLENPDDRSVYVFLDSHIEYLEPYKNLCWYEADGYYVGVTEPLAGNCIK